MSRDVKVADVQEAIAVIRGWANGSGYLPEPKAEILTAIANLLEELLVSRDELVRTNEPR